MIFQTFIPWEFLFLAKQNQTPNQPTQPFQTNQQKIATKADAKHILLNEHVF